MTDFFLILPVAAFFNHFVLVKFLGPSPFTSASRNLDLALGMSIATGFVLTLSTALAWILQQWLLAPIAFEYLQIPAFILVIASIVTFIRIVMKRQNPHLHRVLGHYLPLVAINSVVIGLALLHLQARQPLFDSLLQGFGASLGFGLALVLFTAMCERLEAADAPPALRDMPIALVTAALMSLALFGFTGINV